MGLSRTELKSNSVINKEVNTQNIESWLARMRELNTLDPHSGRAKTPRNPEDLKSIEEENALNLKDFMDLFNNNLLFRLTLFGRFDLIEQWFVHRLSAQDLENLKVLKAEHEERLLQKWYSDPFQDFLKAQREREQFERPFEHQKAWEDYQTALNDMIEKQNVYNKLYQEYQDLSQKYYSALNVVIQGSHAAATGVVNAVVTHAFGSPPPSAPPFPPVGAELLSDADFHAIAEEYVNSLPSLIANANPEVVELERALHLNQIEWDRHKKQIDDNPTTDPNKIKQNTTTLIEDRSKKIEIEEKLVALAEREPEVALVHHQELAIIRADLAEEAVRTDILTQVNDEYEQELNDRSAQLTELEAELSEDFDNLMNLRLNNLRDSKELSDQSEAIEDAISKVESIQKDFENRPTSQKNKAYFEVISPLLEKLKQKPGEKPYSAELQNIISSLQNSKQNIMNEVMVKPASLLSAVIPMPMKQSQASAAAFSDDVVLRPRESFLNNPEVIRSPEVPIVAKEMKADLDDDGLDQKHIEINEHEEHLEPSVDNLPEAQELAQDVPVIPISPDPTPSPTPSQDGIHFINGAPEQPAPQEIIPEQKSDVFIQISRNLKEGVREIKPVIIEENHNNEDQQGMLTIPDEQQVNWNRLLNDLNSALKKIATKIDPQDEHDFNEFSSLVTKLKNNNKQIHQGDLPSLSEKLEQFSNSHPLVFTKINEKFKTIPISINPQEENVPNSLRMS